MSERQKTPGRPRRHTPDEARLLERFKRLSPQVEALRLACTPFSGRGGQFDRLRWIEAFESGAPADIVAVKAVTGLYEGLVNHLVEMLHVAARLRGLEVARREQRPTGPELFAAVAADGGLSENQVEVIGRLYGIRNELQHASPGIEGGEVHDAVVLLTKTLGRFARSYLVWLKRNGIELL